MNRIVRLREEAERDLAAAASWYEQQREGLGHEFLDEALASFHGIGRQPMAYPIVHRDTRRALMSTFPFGIYFRIEERFIVVLAIVHGSRHPHRWQGRG
jgi:plasmid stabilization system protein ParE